MNYSPKVTVNCDGTFTIELLNKADTARYLIYLDDETRVTMEEIADIPASGTSTIYTTPFVVPDHGMASVTASAFKADGSGNGIANSTTLVEAAGSLPAFVRGKTYQYGMSATGTPCSPTTPVDPAPVKKKKGNSGK